MIILDPKKFSELTETSDLDGSEIVPIVKDGENKSASVDTIRAGGPGGTVASVNGKTGSVQITAGSNVTVDNSGANIVVSATGSGAVDSVNGETGVVVLDADDISDTSTANKFVSAADKTKLSNLSGVNTGDQDISGIATNANDIADLQTSKQDTLGFTPENTVNKGQANGYAELDADGKVPSGQLPSYVDDVIEVADYASLPVTGESSKIYITIDDNKSYRRAVS